MEIMGHRVDQDTADMIAKAQDQLAAGGLDDDLREALDNRMCRAYITGDTGLSDYLDNILEQDYQARGGR